MRGLAPIHHRVDDAGMAPERSGHRERHTIVWRSGLRDQSRQILRHVSPGCEHERMYHDPRRPLLDTAGKCLRDRRFRDLHVRGLDDPSGAEALSDERGHFVEQLIGLGAPAPVVDQENRFGTAHPDYLGPSRGGVKKRRGLRGASNASR